MRGRYPSGPEFVHKLDGSSQAKERLEVLLQTLSATCRVGEACERLGLSEQRFDQIRIEALQGALRELEASPAGRPPRVLSAAQAELQQLRDEIARLQAELKAALIRVELAVALPQAGESKKASRSPRRKGRRPSSRKPS
jgi:hypothetical protein